MDSSGNAYLVGTTGSADFPLVSPIQTDIAASSTNLLNLSGAAFVAKISEGNTPITANLFLPIVVSTSGVNSSFYTTELTLTNRGNRQATLQFTYTAVFGGGSGTVSDTLPAGQQRVISDAISYLRSLGVPIPESGNRGGTLLIRFLDASPTLRRLRWQELPREWRAAVLVWPTRPFRPLGL